MRALPILFLSLLFAIACGGGGGGGGGSSLPGPVVISPAKSAPAPKHNVKRLADGHWPSTPEGACARLDECGCNPVKSFKGCVIQQKLALEMMGGIIDLQGDILEMGLEGDQSAEAKLMRDAMNLTGGVIEKGVQSNMAVMATMECKPLCDEMKRQAESQ